MKKRRHDVTGSERKDSVTSDKTLGDSRIGGASTVAEAAFVIGVACGADAAAEAADRACFALEAGRVEECLFWHDVIQDLSGLRPDSMLAEPN